MFSAYTTTSWEVVVDFFIFENHWSKISCTFKILQTTK